RAHRRGPGALPSRRAGLRRGRRRRPGRREPETAGMGRTGADPGLRMSRSTRGSGRNVARFIGLWGSDPPPSRRGDELGAGQVLDYDGVEEDSAMPLRDHFHPPLINRRSWEALHGLWPGTITADLNRRLPERY